MKKYLILLFLTSIQMIRPMEEQNAHLLLFHWFVNYSIPALLYATENENKAFPLWECIANMRPNNVTEVKKMYDDMLPHIITYDYIEDKDIHDNKIIDELVPLLLILQECRYVAKNIGQQAAVRYKTFLNEKIENVHRQTSYVLSFEKSYFGYFPVIALSSFFSSFCGQKNEKYENIQKAELVSDMLVTCFSKNIQKTKSMGTAEDQSKFGNFVKKSIYEHVNACKNNIKTEISCVHNECNSARTLFATMITEWIKKIQLLHTFSKYYFQLVKLRIHSLEKIFVLPEWFVVVGERYGVNFSVQSNSQEGEYIINAHPLPLQADSVTVILSDEKFTVGELPHSSPYSRSFIGKWGKPPMDPDN